MAEYYTLYVDAGANFMLQFEYTNDDDTPFDFSAFDVVMQIRETVESATAVTVVPVIDLETALVTFEMSAEQTADLTESNYVYAIEAQSPEITFRILQGGVKVSPEVVR